MAVVILVIVIRCVGRQQHVGVTFRQELRNQIGTGVAIRRYEDNLFNLFRAMLRSQIDFIFAVGVAWGADFPIQLLMCFHLWLRVIGDQFDCDGNQQGQAQKDESDGEK